MEHSAKLYDVIRIDHFIGMVKYYAIPAESEDARTGQWELGPGMKLIPLSMNLSAAKNYCRRLGREDAGSDRSFRKIRLSGNESFGVCF